jgi:hypothetical protein
LRPTLHSIQCAPWAVLRNTAAGLWNWLIARLVSCLRMTAAIHVPNIHLRGLHRDNFTFLLFCSSTGEGVQLNKKFIDKNHHYNLLVHRSKIQFGYLQYVWEDKKCILPWFFFPFSIYFSSNIIAEPKHKSNFSPAIYKTRNLSALYMCFLLTHLQLWRK